MTQVRETTASSSGALQGERGSLLRTGELAPTFELPDADLNTVNLESFRDQQHVVLYFYPKDDTPGCTIEAIDFSELEDDFRACNSIVLGVSMDDCLTHGAFRDKHGLCVQLLADVDGEVCRRYAVLQEREVEGRRKRNVIRSTFIIDSKGFLRHVLYGVNPRGHAAEVLDLIKGLGKCK